MLTSRQPLPTPSISSAVPSVQAFVARPGATTAALTQGRAERYDGAGAEAVGERADDLHACEGARAEQQQEPAEHGMVDPCAVLDAGDVDDPHSQDEAVQGEVSEGGQPTGPQQSLHGANITNKNLLRKLVI
jgi:hypothetical protein